MSVTTESAETIDASEVLSAPDSSRSESLADFLGTSDTPTNGDKPEESEAVAEEAQEAEAPEEAAEETEPEKPALPTQEEQLSAAEIARQGYQLRMQRQQQAQASRQAREQALQEREQWMKDFTEALKQGQGTPQAAEETPEEKDFYDDPKGAFESAKQEMEALLKQQANELAELRQWRDGIGQQQQAQQAYQQQLQAKSDAWQQDIAEWESQESLQGFMGQYDPQTGALVQPGVLEAWSQAMQDRLSPVMSQPEVQQRIAQTLDYFRQQGQAYGQNPCYFLELHASQLGVGDQFDSAPAAATAAQVPATSRHSSEAAQAVAAARAAQEAGMAGTIGDGAQGGGNEMPGSIEELMEAGISGAQYAAALRQKYPNLEDRLNHMLNVKGRPPSSSEKV